MKKVLASVLAGSMVLGMAAAASAATNLTLKESKNKEYDYSLVLFEGDGSFITTGWDVDDSVAFDEALKEYQSLVKSARKYSSNDIKNGEMSLSQFKKLMNARDAVYSSLLDAERTKINMTGAANSGSANYDTVEREVTASPAVYTSMDSIVTDLSNGNTAWDPDSWKLNLIQNKTMGTGEYIGNNKDYIDISDSPYDHHMYNYGEDHVKEVKFEVVVQKGEDFRTDVASGKVTVSRKRIDSDSKTDTDTYLLTVKAAAGVRDFELDDWKIELDLHDANRVYFIEGDVAYSDYREVDPDERYIIKKSNKDDEHNDGCVFNFNEVIDEETRVVCSDYVDLIFKGNYGTDFENLRVMDDDMTEVEDFFQDYDIDYYDFIGTPKFAKDITVRIDADSDAYIYEYDKKTGDVVDITDECEYTSDGMTFKRKSLKTYVVLEEPYEGGNVKAEKEPVSEEPEDEPEDTEEPADDTNNAGSKPNPGTGAYPLF